MFRNKKLLYVVLALVALGLLGCSSTGSLNAQAAPAKPTAAKPALKDLNVAGDPKAKVKIVAFYPLNESHRYIADYLLALPKKFNNKIYVEVYDMQAEKNQEKWQKSGLQCAGVMVNGKYAWDVTREGKKETVTFVKRMGVMWTAADFEAVVASQLRNPREIPAVPKEQKPNKPAGK